MVFPPFCWLVLARVLTGDWTVLSRDQLPSQDTRPPLLTEGFSLLPDPCGPASTLGPQRW